ncbi:hypothetical protein IAT40_006359 [Kwoniella sp. CBS 6097]
MPQGFVNTNTCLGVNQLKRDLSSMSKEIRDLSKHLLEGPPNLSPNLQTKLPTPPSTPSRFTRFISRHRNSLKRKGRNGNGDMKNKKAYDKLDETPLLARRESDDSDKTLVDPQNDFEGHIADNPNDLGVDGKYQLCPGMSGQEGCLGSTMEADKLLSVLAPHIAELQRIGSRLNSYKSSLSRARSTPPLLSISPPRATHGGGVDTEPFKLFRDICSALLGLLKELKQPMATVPSLSFKSPFECTRANWSAHHPEQEQEQEPEQVQDHDLEMRDLMISALIKKVEFELSRFPGTETLPTSFNSRSPAHSARTLADTSNTSNHHHSLAPPSDRASSPFVIHSTGLLAPPVNLPITTTGSQALLTANPNANGIRRGSDPIKISLTASPITNTYDQRDQSQSGSRGPGFSEYEYLTDTTAQNSGGWAKNLVRLGSYQASLLFSNSPVAVRRPGTRTGLETGLGQSGKA